MKTKNLKSLLLNFCIISGSSLQFVNAQNYSGGNGTTIDPYQIANKADLKYLSENSGEWTKHFIQTDNITFTPTDYQTGGDFYNGGSGFMSIGKGLPFEGSYDGLGHSINNLKIDVQASSYNEGMFGICSGASISNLHLEVQIENLFGLEATGGMVGHLSNSSQLTNCSVGGGVVSGGDTGGLVGVCVGSSIINCNSHCTVSTPFDYQGSKGGIAARMMQSTLTKSYSTGYIDANNAAGGLVGEVGSSNISECYSTSYVYETINPSGMFYNPPLGGLVGILTNSTLTNTYRNGVVSGTSYASVGGLVGINDQSTINNSYAVSSLYTLGSIGGLVGMDYGGLANNSYWNTDVYSGPSPIGIGKTTSELQTESTFTSASWDFIGETQNGTNDIWGICNPGSYPVFNPTADAPTNVTECDSYVLPYLTEGNYYTSSGGNGTMLSAGTNITSNQTLYVFADNAGCTDENTFTVTINTAPTADAPTNVTECDSYVLPSLTEGNYYTSSGGNGTMLSPGASITSNQTLYVFAGNACSTDENTFNVTINTTPTADAPTNVTECDSYVLPSLTEGNYYTSSGGTGTMLSPGASITSNQTLYVFADNAGCTDENTFTVTINTAPTADAPTNVTECDSYVLPILTEGNYYTSSGGNGTMLSAGASITSNQTLYVFADNAGCTDENTFTVTINTTPTADAPTNVTECDSYVLPILTEGNYYTSSGGTGTMLSPGASITSNQTLYVFADNAGCTDENTFTVTINQFPDASTALSGTTISVMNNGASYQWLDCNNNYDVISGETGQTFTATVNGNYAVELTENGCVDTSDCVAITTVGMLENNFGNDFIIYPNPTSGNFSIDLGSIFENSEISITDISGKLIYSKTITQSQILNLSIAEPDGIYIVSVQAGDKKAVIRLIKQ